jgi:steroid delta-isomerase-like uncharacterized protein
MAQTKTGNDATASSAVADPKPTRRRITRRKAVETHVRSYFDALGRRDTDDMAKHWRDDGVLDAVALGVFRGTGEIVGMFRELFAALPDVETTVVRVVAGEHEAAVEWRMVGHFTGEPLEGVDPTGKRIDLRGVDYLEVEDGQIVSNTAYYDGMSFARHICLMPPQDSGAERAMKGAFNAATRVRRAVAERRAGR